MHVNILLENKIRNVIKFEEIKTLPLESYLKKNLELGSDSLIGDVCKTFVPTIDSSIKTVAIVKEVPKAKQDTAPEYEQLSLFAFIDDED